MPSYIFENPQTGEQTEIIQGINEDHRFVDNNGTEWRRIFVNPNVSTDTQFNPLSSKDFVEKTRNKKGSLGEIWDKSKELSEKRKEITGEDGVLKNYYKKYSEQRRGKLHDDVRKQNAAAKLNKLGVEIE